VPVVRVNLTLVSKIMPIAGSIQYRFRSSRPPAGGAVRFLCSVARSMSSVADSIPRSSTKNYGKPPGIQSFSSRQARDGRKANCFWSAAVGGSSFARFGVVRRRDQMPVPRSG
jgi:hypothetical protein